MANIKLQPDQLRDYAGKIRGNANEASDLAQRIKANITAVTDAWEGEAKNKYLSAWAEHEPTLSVKVPELLSTLAQNLETIAQNFEIADKT